MMKSSRKRSKTKGAPLADEFFLELFENGSTRFLVRHRVSCCSRRSALTARRNTEYHQCSLARPARSDCHVLSIRASQIIFPVVQLRAGVLRSPFLSPPFARVLSLPIATLFDRQTLLRRRARHQC